MRLSLAEIEAIVISFQEVFGGGDVYLFGSRVNENAKGGDIDLYLVPKTTYIESHIEKKLHFLQKVKEKIGDQKIDAIVAVNSSRAIEQEAKTKGVKLSLEHIKIQRYLQQSQKHKIRIVKSYEKVKDIFPLSASRYEALSDDEIEAIDQYLFRFAKLQDTLGAKLFRLIVLEYEENIEQMKFIDILNRLEKIGILKASTWQRLRDIRNEISHQYDDIPQESAQLLNAIFAHKEELLTIFDNIVAHYQKEGLV